MSSSAALLGYVESLTQAIANLSTLTSIEAVQQINAGGLSALPSPGIGVFLSPPQPSINSLMVHGQNAYDLWGITIVISIGQSVTQTEGLILALDVASVIRKNVGQPWSSSADLMPDADAPISIIENTASSTIVFVQYAYPYSL